MGLVTEVIAAAAAPVKANLATGKWWEKSTSWRKICHIGLVGSTAIADCELEVLYGSTKVANIMNSTAGAAKLPTHDVDFRELSSMLMCPPNQAISVNVVVAPTTNPIALCMDIAEVSR